MSEPRVFKNRVEGGQVLAQQLRHYTNRDDVIVLGLPRGGVEVAYEVAKALAVPMDILVVRKIGMPGYEEMAIGAIASGEVVVMNEELAEEFTAIKDKIESVIEKERKELKRREYLYRDNRPLPELTGKTVILVDDGLATGATMYAAVKAIRRAEPAWIIVAVPVASLESCEIFNKEADEFICVYIPESFYAVGKWYEDFTPTSDETVKKLLELSRRPRHVSSVFQ